MNVHRYVWNNPVNWNDPSGLSPAAEKAGSMTMVMAASGIVVAGLTYKSIADIEAAVQNSSQGIFQGIGSKTACLFGRVWDTLRAAHKYGGVIGPAGLCSVEGGAGQPGGEPRGGNGGTDPIAGGPIANPAVPGAKPNSPPFIPPVPLAASPSPSGDPENEYCRKLREKINSLRNNIAKREYDLAVDPLGLPEFGSGANRSTRQGHRRLIRRDYMDQRRYENKYYKKC